MTIDPAAIEKAYSWACEHARTRAVGGSEVEDELTDAATNAVLWAIQRCTNADTFTNFAKAAVRRWVARQAHRIKLKRRNRPRAADPHHEGTVDDARARQGKPTKPTLIQELPEDLAFVVRLYMVDGYSMREIGLLVGCSPNTVDLKLKRAAALLNDGPLVAPVRRNGEKRLTAG